MGDTFPFILQSELWAAKPDPAQGYEHARQDISSILLPQLDHHLRYFSVQGDKFTTEKTFVSPKLSFFARRNLASQLDAFYSLDSLEPGLNVIINIFNLKSQNGSG